MKITILILLAFVTLAITTGCKNKNLDTVSEKNIINSQIQNNTNQTKNLENKIREIKITAKRFEYSPNEIILQKGEKVKLIIDNIDFIHGLHFEDLPGEPGDNYEYIFEANEIGEFEFHCNRFCGAGHSQMKGKIIVVE